MIQDEIIRMAREAGFETDEAGVWITDGYWTKELERFATLVAAHERNRHAWTQEHWTEYEHAIAAAEREACAKVCDDIDTEYEGEDVLATWCAAAIRARSQHE